MSAETENLYTGKNPLIANIYDCLSGDNQSEEAISLLLNSNTVSPNEKIKILGILSEKDERFHSLLVQTVLNNVYTLEDTSVFTIIDSFFERMISQAYLLDDNAVIKIFQHLFYLISQGVAEFYPYIWKLTRKQNITTYNSRKLRIICHYAVVFSFDGYNSKAIKEILKSNCTCSEQALNAFKSVKTKEEYAYSQYAKALLYLMQQAFRKQSPNYDEFDEYLSDIPNKYREEFHVDSLSRNSERLYAHLYGFFENGGQKQVYNF